MRRRELLLALATGMMSGRALRAQQKAMLVIGFLGAASPAQEAPYVAAFRQGLSDTGYVAGQNVAIEYRWAEGHYDRLPTLAGDPVAVGLVVSFARPGGNVTGFTFLTAELIPKLLDLLTELVPQASVIALLVNPNNPNAGRYTAGA